MPKVGSTHYPYTAAGKKAAAAARKAGKGKSKPKPKNKLDVQPIFGGQTQVKGIKKETSRSGMDGLEWPCVNFLLSHFVESE